MDSIRTIFKEPIYFQNGDVLRLSHIYNITNAGVLIGTENHPIEGFAELVVPQKVKGVIIHEYVGIPKQQLTAIISMITESEKSEIEPAIKALKKHRLYRHAKRLEGVLRLYGDIERLV